MLPKRLSEGDLVGIVSPSNPLTPDQEDELSAGIKVVQRLGLRVRLSKNMRSATLGFSATPREKAADINEMFADAAVKAVFCAQGETPRRQHSMPPEAGRDTVFP